MTPFLAYSVAYPFTAAGRYETHPWAGQNRLDQIFRVYATIELALNTIDGAALKSS